MDDGTEESCAIDEEHILVIEGPHVERYGLAFDGQTTFEHARIERRGRLSRAQHLLEEAVVFHWITEREVSRDIDGAIGALDQTAKGIHASPVAGGGTKEPVGKHEPLVVVDLDVG